MAVSFKGPIFHRTSCSWASADTWRIPLEARAMAKTHAGTWGPGGSRGASTAGWSRIVHSGKRHVIVASGWCGSASAPRRACGKTGK